MNLFYLSAPLIFLWKAVKTLQLSRDDLLLDDWWLLPNLYYHTYFLTLLLYSVVLLLNRFTTSFVKYIYSLDSSGDAVVFSRRESCYIEEGDHGVKQLLATKLIVVNSMLDGYSWTSFTLLLNFIIQSSSFVWYINFLANSGLLYFILFLLNYFFLILL